jgi:hypothetical protein
MPSLEPGEGAWRSGPPMAQPRAVSETTGRTALTSVVAPTTQWATLSRGPLRGGPVEVRAVPGVWPCAAITLGLRCDESGSWSTRRWASSYARPSRLTIDSAALRNAKGCGRTPGRCLGHRAGVRPDRCAHKLNLGPGTSCTKVPRDQSLGRRALTPCDRSLGRRSLTVGVQRVVARPGWTMTSGVGRTAGPWPCRRQIQETPRILIPFPELVLSHPAPDRTGYGGAQGGDWAPAGLSVRPSSVGRPKKLQVFLPTPHTLQLSYY